MSGSVGSSTRVPTTLGGGRSGDLFEYQDRAGSAACSGPTGHRIAGVLACDRPDRDSNVCVYPRDRLFFQISGRGVDKDLCGSEHSNVHCDDRCPERSACS